ncbi:MAG: hypothetical protein AB8B64_11980 [Granulosicoccus sp.]
MYSAAVFDRWTAFFNRRGDCTLKYIASSLTLIVSLVVGCSSSSTITPPEEGQTPVMDAGIDGSDTEVGADTTDLADGGTPSTDGNTSGDILQLGFVDIEESQSSSTVEAAGVFFQFDSAITAAQVDAELQFSGQEQCTVVESEIIGGFVVDPIDVNVTFISAGDVITLSGLTGSYGEIVLLTDIGFTNY